MSQNQITLNLISLGLGLFLFYALNQHFIGHSAAGVCQFIEHTKNNFLTEIAILAVAVLVIVGLVFLWRNAAVLLIVAMIGLGCLAFGCN
jgi:small-conductance mechanosensitive channel